MNNEQTIDELLKQLDQEMEWFNGDSFRLEEARKRFLRIKEIADQAEQQLLSMKNDIKILSEE